MRFFDRAREYKAIDIFVSILLCVSMHIIIKKEQARGNEADQSAILLAYAIMATSLGACLLLSGSLMKDYVLNRRRMFIEPTTDSGNITNGEALNSGYTAYDY